MVSRIDQRRLNDGASAGALSEPQTLAEAKAKLERLGDAVAAMQSLDDLGSPEANKAAMADADALMRRYLDLRQAIASGAFPE